MFFDVEFCEASVHVAVRCDRVAGLFLTVMASYGLVVGGRLLPWRRPVSGPIVPPIARFACELIDIHPVGGCLCSSVAGRIWAVYTAFCLSDRDTAHGLRQLSAGTGYGHVTTIRFGLCFSPVFCLIRCWIRSHHLLHVFWGAPLLTRPCASRKDTIKWGGGQYDDCTIGTCPICQAA